MKTAFFTKAKNKIINIEHTVYLRMKRARLKNPSPTIISNNCVAGVIYHDLGLKFNSPTINLYFKADDYIKFAENLAYYLSLEVKEVPSDLPYPVGSIGDVKLFFMHYKSFEEAKAKWEERSGRVDYKNLYFIMTEKEGCSLPLIEQFDNLKYDRKVLFTHIPMPNIKSAFFIPGFENASELGVITDPKKSFWRRRYIDDFDYVQFFNTGIHY